MKSPAKRRLTRSSPRPSALSSEVVIAAALGLLDEQGLDGFSLRNLAKRLGVYPTAVYWYVPTRNQLLAKAADAALSEIEERPFANWQEALSQLFSDFRAAVRRHPNIAPLLGTQLVANAGINLKFIERILSALARAGFKDAALTNAYNVVIALLVGFTTQELAQMPGDDTIAWQDDVQSHLNTVDPEATPVLAANMTLLANHAFILRWDNGVTNPLDDSFEFAIATLINGFETLLNATR